LINDHLIEVLGSLFFAVAVLHTFVAGKILSYSKKFSKGSVAEASLHLLGEIEIVFGFWAAIFMTIFAVLRGVDVARAYHESLHFTEPIFVFCIMVLAATKPIMLGARSFIQLIGNFISKVFGLPGVLVDTFVVLTLGPLAGSLITEPAATRSPRATSSTGPR
jgi:hypothetical protein